jgi:hypothetical protein
MSSDLQFLFVGGCAWLLFMVLLVGGIVLLVRAVTRSLDAASRAWRELAEAHGLHFQHRPPRVSGQLGGATVVIATSVSGPAGQTRTSTRVRLGTPTTGPETDWLRVTPRGLAGLEASLGAPGHTLSSGAAAFDARFQVHTRDAERARSLLRQEVVAGLAAFPRDAVLSCTDGARLLTWSGMEGDRSVLEAALRLLALAGP